MLMWCNITKKHHENTLSFVTIIISQIKFLQCFTAKRFPLGSIPLKFLPIKGNGLVINYEESAIMKKKLFFSNKTRPSTYSFILQAQSLLWQKILKRRKKRLRKKDGLLYLNHGLLWLNHSNNLFGKLQEKLLLNEREGASLLGSLYDICSNYI